MGDVTYFDQPLVRKAKAALSIALIRLEADLKRDLIPPDKTLFSMFRLIEFLHSSMSEEAFLPIKNRVLPILERLREVAVLQIKDRQTNGT